MKTTTPKKNLQLKSAHQHRIQKNQYNTDAYRGMSFDRIGPDLVVSRDSEGHIASYFVQKKWSFPAHAYSSTDNPDFYFDVSLSEPHADQNNFFVKAVFVTKMFSPHTKTGAPVRLPGMHATHNSLNLIVRHAQQCNIPVTDLFNSLDLMKSYISKCSTSEIKHLKSIARTISNNNLSMHGITIHSHVLSQLTEIARTTRSSNESDQTPVIPSRILARKYMQYKTCLKEYKHHKLRLHKLIVACSNNKQYGRSGPKYGPNRTHHPNFEQAVAEHGLSELAKKYKWRNVFSLPKHLRRVQCSAKNLIHLFTLMRDHEALNLRPDCIEKVPGWKGNALYVKTVTTKLTGEPERLKWITVSAIREPFEALESIHNFICPYISNKDMQQWLMVSPTFLPCCGIAPSEDRVQRSFDRDLMPPVYITEQDIMELESIDSTRNWRADKKFRVGEPWIINSHQFRRSISVYAGQSGLITIQSLKRLLQHLTETMSVHYQKGCAAENYIIGFELPKLAKEMMEAKAEADNALYLRNVLLTKEVLGGFHGRKAQQQNVEAVWIHKQDQFNRRVKQGLQSFEPNCFGGCACPHPCDKRAHSDITSCSGCEYCIVIPSTINATISELKYDLEQLKPGTVEYRAEEQNLKDFEVMRDRLIAVR
ncbi:hypothetical protein [Pseudomonas viridiflava]|uniref:hypothetical protein n=1 Tax=Pseudomonas viridiflava TaxID=33069 RepID=UPI000F043BAA|nr:hypothetical protein [Pseudomonas viridiflava]